MQPSKFLRICDNNRMIACCDWMNLFSAVTFNRPANKFRCSAASCFINVFCKPLIFHIHSAKFRKYLFWTGIIIICNKALELFYQLLCPESLLGLSYLQDAFLVKLRLWFTLLDKRTYQLTGQTGIRWAWLRHSHFSDQLKLWLFISGH